MRSPEEWQRIHMSGAISDPEEIRLRGLPYVDFIAEVQRDALAPSPAVAPTPAIIICPVCHTQHIDKDEWATTRIHKNHLCAVCGLIWRPDGVPAPSVGVAELPKS